MIEELAHILCMLALGLALALVGGAINYYFFKKGK